MPDPNTPLGPKGIYVIPEADTSEVRAKYLDISYAEESFFQKLDIYLPPSAPRPEGYPLLVFLHGGAWMMGDKKDCQLSPALKALERGIAVASVNYRLSQEATFPAQIHDVKAAIRWLRANSGTYSLNTERIAIWGASAGAHLAELTGTSAGIKELEDPAMGNADKTSAVQAVVSWFGPTNFLLMDRYLQETGNGVPDHCEADSPESRLLGGRITELPDLVKKANPETWLRSDCPPFLLQHGDLDQLVPHQLSQDFAEKITATAGPERVELSILKGARHADAEFETKENVEKILNFIEANIR